MDKDISGNADFKEVGQSKIPEGLLKQWEDKADDQPKSPIEYNSDEDFAWNCGWSAGYLQGRKDQYLSSLSGDKQEAIGGFNVDGREPWIAVEDQLPKDADKVLFMFCGKKMLMGEFIETGNGNPFFLTDQSAKYYLNHVTHWQPLPPPPIESPASRTTK